MNPGTNNNSTTAVQISLNFYPTVQDPDLGEWLYPSVNHMNLQEDLLLTVKLPPAQMSWSI